MNASEPPIFTLARAFHQHRHALTSASKAIPVIDAAIMKLVACQVEGIRAKSVTVGVVMTVCGMFGRYSFLGDRAHSLMMRAEATDNDALWTDIALWNDIHQLFADAREFATMNGQ